jgi:hypothetical protein
MDKFLKAKASSYVNDADVPKDLELRFQVTLTGEGSSPETVEIYQAGDAGDWYAKSGYTRGYVKMLKSTTSGLAEDVGSPHRRRVPSRSSALSSPPPPVRRGAAKRRSGEG